MIKAILTDQKRRRWNPFRRRRFVLSIPQNWDEVMPLARRQRWWHWAATLPADESKGKIIRDLVPRRWRKQIHDLDMGAMAGQIEWTSPNPDATVIPLKSFWHQGIRYVFPIAKGGNVSCVEFALCEDYYRELDAGDSDALLRLSACIWREADTDEREMLKRGDERVKLHSKEEVEARVARLAGAPPEVHLQALTWWIGMKQLVNKIYGSWLFEQDEEDDDDDETDAPSSAKASASRGPDFGWWGIFLDVAESGTFGTKDQVYQESIHDICIFLVKKRAAANQAPEPQTSQKPSEEED